MVRTETRKVIMDYLKQYKREHDGCSPSYRQIMAACNLKSTGTVSYQLQQLADCGYVWLPKDGTRGGIEIVGGQWAMFSTKTDAMLDAAIVAMMRAWREQEYFGEAQRLACLQLCICDIVAGARSANVKWWDAKITARR